MTARETWAVLPEDHDAAVKLLTDIIDSMTSLLARERRLHAAAVNQLDRLRKDSNKLIQQTIRDAQNLSRLQSANSELLKQKAEDAQTIAQLQSQIDTLFK